MPDDSNIRTKALACAGLVCIQTAVGVLYKASQRGGAFKYSTTSAVTMAEAVKFLLSVSFHIMEHREEPEPVAAAWASVKAQLPLSAVFQIWIVSALYAFNNQLSFFVYLLADPGTVFLFKAGSTLIVALVQYFFVGKDFRYEQWRAMLLQGVGMIVVQYDPCRSAPLYRPLAYGCMALSTIVTAATTVRNEYQVKSYKIGLNVQNATLYAGGIWMNLLAFFFVPNPNSTQAQLGFFEGYGNPLAVGVVVCNGLIGLAITAVYKYADAVTKCIAGDITAVLLCIISSFIFGLRSSITTWCGVFVVTFAVHLYMEAGRLPTALPAPAPAAPAMPASGSSETTPAANFKSSKSASEAKSKTLQKDEAEAALAKQEKQKAVEKSLENCPEWPRHVIAIGVALPIVCASALAAFLYPELFGLDAGVAVRGSEVFSIGKLYKDLQVREASECLMKASEDVTGSSSQGVKSRSAAMEVLGHCVKTLHEALPAKQP